MHIVYPAFLDMGTCVKADIHTWHWPEMGR